MRQQNNEKKKYKIQLDKGYHASPVYMWWFATATPILRRI